LFQECVEALFRALHAHQRGGGGDEEQREGRADEEEKLFADGKAVQHDGMSR
jgi:hypothetical protein